MTTSLGRQQHEKNQEKNQEKNNQHQPIPNNPTPHEGMDTLSLFCGREGEANESSAEKGTTVFFPPQMYTYLVNKKENEKWN